MLHIHFMQHLSANFDPAMQSARYGIPLVRRLAGPDATEETVSNETTILKFHYLLKRYGLTWATQKEINILLGELGLTLSQGTTVEATLVATPAATEEPQGQARSADPLDE